MKTASLLSVMVTALAIGLAIVTQNGIALADKAYHTERLTFEAVGDDPEIRAGQVINAHSNGPIRYAREEYVINGALANATYEVHILVFFGGECTDDSDLDLITAELQTGANGQGHAYHVFVPADVEPFNPPLTVNARWVLVRDGDVQYQTECTVINLD